MNSYRFNFIWNQNINKNIKQKVANYSVMNLTNHEFNEHTYNLFNAHATNLTNIWYVWRIRNESRTCNRFAIEQEIISWFYLFFFHRKMINKYRKFIWTYLRNDFIKHFVFFIFIQKSFISWTDSFSRWMYKHESKNNFVVFFDECANAITWIVIRTMNHFKKRVIFETVQIINTRNFNKFEFLISC